MNFLNTWKSAIAPLLIAIGLLFIGNGLTAIEGADGGKPALDPPAKGQDIYVVGNSMFGTGLNLAQLRDGFPEQEADFAYYNGHYTSMWHLAATVGMNKSNVPDTIVWGFRPTYAVLPAFRVNKDTLETAFAPFANANHKQVLATAQDPNAIDVVGTDDPNNRIQAFAGAQSIEPFERFGAISAEHFKAPFVLTNETISPTQLSVSAISGELENLAISLLGMNGIKTEEGRARPSDLLISYVTSGRVKRADALVVDNGERFVQGVPVPLEGGFVPLIHERFEQLGTKQVVVIFKPVQLFNGKMNNESEQLYADALAYFAKHDVIVVDMIADPEMTQDLYAKGDHFTEAGMTHVTKRIIEGIKRANN